MINATPLDTVTKHLPRNRTAFIIIREGWEKRARAKRLLNRNIPLVEKPFINPKDIAITFPNTAEMHPSDASSIIPFKSRNYGVGTALTPHVWMLTLAANEGISCPVNWFQMNKLDS